MWYFAKLFPVLNWQRLAEVWASSEFEFSLTAITGWLFCPWDLILTHYKGVIFSSALLLQNNSHSPGRGEEHHHCWPCPSLRSTPSPECLCLCSAAFSGANFWHKRYDCSVACSWPKWTKMAFRNTILLHCSFTLFLVTSAFIFRKKSFG